MKLVNRLLLALLLLASTPVLAANSETTNQLPAASTLTGAEPVPIWQGNQTVQTTAQTIANLTGSSSPGTPGGSSTNLQYNCGGMFCGISAPLYVQAFGAKCDGHILTSGVIVTANSNDIYSLQYDFVTGDIGATITLTSPGAANTYFQSQTLTTTIASISSSGGHVHAQLTATPTWGSSSYTWASARWYHTDDSVAIQNALNYGATQYNFMAPGHYVGGGNIRFPTGVCVAKNLIFYANQEISGESTNSSIVMLAANANTDLFRSYNFAGTDDATGQYDPIGVVFDNLTLDGNRGSNTGSGIGSPSGTGSVLRWRGSNKNIRNVHANFAAGDGIFLMGGDGPGVPAYIFGNLAQGLFGMDGFEDHIDNLYAFYNGGWGLVDDGSGDSDYYNIWVSGNNTGGLLNETTQYVFPVGNGSPLSITNLHGYSETFPDLEFDTPYGGCTHCDLETGGIVNASGISFVDSDTRATLQIGKSGSSGIGGLSFKNFNTPTLNNQYSAASNNGASDQWVNSAVTSITGTYAPNVTVNSTGFGYQQQNITGGGPISFADCATSGSNSCVNKLQFNVTSTLATASTNTTPNPFMAVDTSQNIAFGPGATTPNQYEGIDFHTVTSTMGLPSGTLAQRPPCQGSNAGSIRFDITTGNVEFCAGNAIWTTFGTGTVSLGTPNQFTAGQSVTPVTVTPTSSVNYTPNFALSNDFIVTLTSSCPCTLVNPANIVAGQSGMIFVYQSGSGSNTIGTYGGFYKFSGGTPPTLSTGANALDVFSYVTPDATHILISPSYNFH